MGRLRKGTVAAFQTNSIPAHATSVDPRMVRPVRCQVCPLISGRGPHGTGKSLAPEIAQPRPWSPSPCPSNCHVGITKPVAASNLPCRPRYISDSLAVSLILLFRLYCNLLASRPRIDFQVLYLFARLSVAFGRIVSRVN